MAWTAEFERDVDKVDVGTLTAIWNIGLVDEFRYTERGQTNTGGANAFVTRAKAALAANITKEAAETTIQNTITTKLNA